MRFFTDNKDDNKASTVQSCFTPSGYSCVTISKLDADHKELVNYGGKSTGSCRLFGIELRNTAYVSPTLEKVSDCPENLSTVEKKQEMEPGKIDEIQNSVVVEPSQVIIDAQTKQYSQPSARSRTKV